MVLSLIGLKRVGDLSLNQLSYKGDIFIFYIILI